MEGVWGASASCSAGIGMPASPSGLGPLPAALHAPWPAAAAAADSAADCVASTLDLVSIILASAPHADVATVARAACASKLFATAASPVLRHLHASTWHPVYLARWWSREAAAARWGA
jgi:hypothetical protein